MRQVNHMSSGEAGTTSRQEGYVVAVVASMLLTFAAMMVLVMDVGVMYVEKQRLQSAADSAAMAGARELQRGKTGLVVSSARAESAANGYTDGVNGVTVTPHYPPISGPSTGDLYHVEVVVTHSLPTTTST